MKKKDILEREVFLNVYSEFNNWMHSIGFRPGSYKESSTNLDYHYSLYDKYIDSMFSVECYVHDVLDFHIRFLRDRFEHKFMIVGNLGGMSEVYYLNDFKNLLYNELKALKEQKLNALNEILL